MLGSNPELGEYTLTKIKVSYSHIINLPSLSCLSILNPIYTLSGAILEKMAVPA